MYIYASQLCKGYSPVRTIKGTILDVAAATLKRCRHPILSTSTIEPTVQEHVF